MSRYNTLLFDVDDTLIDFQETERLSMQSLFTKHGIPLDDDVKERYLRINQELWTAFEQGKATNKEIETRFQRLFDELQIVQDGLAFEQEYKLALGQTYPLVEGATEIVEQLAKTHRLFVVTNSVGAMQRNRLSMAGLTPFMKEIFISDEVGYQKPMKEFFDHVFHRIPQLDLSTTLIIGDSLTSDITGGMRAGIDTCWFNPRGKQGRADVVPTYQISSLEQLLQLV